jgi:hypothetical protein
MCLGNTLWRILQVWDQMETIIEHHLLLLKLTKNELHHTLGG